MAELLKVQGLKKYFRIKKDATTRRAGTLKAVDDISITIQKGETMGLVGESGCGKTTFGRTIMRLYEPTAGRILYDGSDISKLDAKAMLPFRKRMQMIFQDPYASLDPRMNVGEIIGEAFRIHGGNAGARARHERILELMNTVGLKTDRVSSYPHEFSGGQRQRIGIARALAVEPEFIVCDEPISALDVSIQAQIVNLLENLQEKMGLTYLFVSHDLSMVRHISHNVGVMYLGHLVEYAGTDELFTHMLHPYTKALLSALPIPDPDLAAKSHRIILRGDVPSPLDPPSGCPFRTRCPICDKACAESRPKLRDAGGGHMVACHKV